MKVNYFKVTRNINIQVCCLKVLNVIVLDELAVPIS